ncbi:MAG TPA: hypothetical protein VHG53_01220 [Candidatus Limnocylindria bacterium]|nr:hypothetical protein [Candidatus Limnocylindria bacterium]
MSRLFADPLPAHMEWHEGEPGALRVGHRRLVVVEVVRRWRVDGEWWADGLAREYLTLRTADGLLCDVFGDRRTGAWFLQRVMD